MNKSSFLHRVSGESNLCIGIDPNYACYQSWSPLLEQQVNRYGPVKTVENISKCLLQVAKENKVSRCKFQSAYFEAYGAEGFDLQMQLAEYATTLGIKVLCDVKRGDIASTMHSYGEAFLDNDSVDAITVTAYMGTDVLIALKPFLERGKGVYVVLLSSNPSGMELQGQKLANGTTIAQCLMELIDKEMASVGHNIGFVVGATIIDQIDELFFEQLSNKSVLMPGFGAQGAKMSPRFESIFKKTNTTAILPISRGISLFGLSTAKVDLQRVKTMQDYADLVSRHLSMYRGKFAS